MPKIVEESIPVKPNETLGSIYNFLVNNDVMAKLNWELYNPELLFRLL